MMPIIEKYAENHTPKRMKSSDDLSQALKSKLEEKYSHTYNHGKEKQGEVIVAKDEKFINKMTFNCNGDLC